MKSVTGSDNRRGISRKCDLRGSFSLKAPIFNLNCGDEENIRIKLEHLYIINMKFVLQMEEGI